MPRIHRYTTCLSWTGSTAAGYRGYSRNHLAWTPTSPVEVPMSSDPAFRGARERLNPEQLLVMAASSCQMLWFLHLAAEAGLDVREYLDRAEAVMPADGARVSITRIRLAPRITVA